MTDDERRSLWRLRNRLKAIRDAAEKPARGFNLQWQLGRLQDEMDALGHFPYVNLDSSYIMKKKHRAPTTTALERLREKVPDGPPFLGILLDEASMRCLAAGVVNSRAEVAAIKVLADFDAYTLTSEKNKPNR